MTGLKPLIEVSIYVILRLLTERQIPAACVRHFCPVVFSRHSPEGKVLNIVLQGEAMPRGLNPYPLPFFPLTIDYPTHPRHILQLVNSLSFDTDPKPEKGTPFVRSLSVKVIIVNTSPSQV